MGGDTPRCSGRAGPWRRGPGTAEQAVPPSGRALAVGDPGRPARRRGGSAVAHGAAGAGGGGGLPGTGLAGVRASFYPSPPPTRHTTPPPLPPPTARVPRPARTPPPTTS